MAAEIYSFSRWAERIRIEQGTTPYTWVIGAGFSVSAGIPLASGVTDRLILFEYCCQEKQRCWSETVPCGRVTYSGDLEPFLEWYAKATPKDLDEPLQKAKAWFRNHPDFGQQPETSPLTYSLLFSRFLQDTTLHHQFLTHLVRLAKGVNLAHLCLAAFLLKSPARCHTVFTTNFDDLLLKAILLLGGAARIFGELDSKDTPALVNVSYPQIVHLHGRHTGYKLRNTAAQLQAHDPVLGNAILSHLQNSHLIVTGYSGWDDTVMRALAEWPSRPNLLRGNLYWVPYQSADSILKETRDFLDKCPASRAFIVENNEKTLDADRFMLHFLKAFDDGAKENTLKWARDAILENAREQHKFILTQLEKHPDFREQKVGDLLDAARMARGAGKLDEARGFFDRAVLLVKDHEKGGERGRVFLEKANFERYVDNLVQCRKDLATALMVFQIEKDIKGEANVLEALGDLELRESRLSEARKRYEEALPLYRAIGDRLGEANALKSLGDLERRESRLSEARKRYEEALPLYRSIGARLGEANALTSLGDLELRESRLSEARKRYEEALPLYRSIGSRLGEANALTSLGDLELRESRLSEARKRYEEALPLYRSIGARLGEANTLSSLGDLELREDRLSEARKRYEEALPLYRSIGDRLGEAEALNGFGRLHLKEGNAAGALKLYDQALDIFTSIPDHFNMASVLWDKGEALDFLDRRADAEQAREAAAREAELGANRGIKAKVQTWRDEPGG